MKTRLYSDKLLSVLAIIVLVAIAGSDLLAQNFTNDAGGTYAGGANSVIRMKNVSGRFDGTAQLGLTTSRIPGTVDWASTTAAQGVQGLYYTNLTLTGNTKNVETNCYVFQVYNPTASGTRTYNGIFHYDGAAQNIASEVGASSTDNRYATLDLIGTGAKTVVASGDVHVANDLTGSAALEVYANMRINQVAGTGSTVNALTVGDGTNIGLLETNTQNVAFVGAGTITNGTIDVHGAGNATFSSTINVDGNGTLKSEDAQGDIKIATGGTLTLAAAGTGGKLEIGQNDSLIVTGTFTNSFAAATNMTYKTGSVEQYDGGNGQNIVETVTSNPYANLTVLGAGATKTTLAGDIYVNENFALGEGAGTLLDMTAGTKTLHMTTGTATYTGLSEVTGRMQRSGIANATAYTFNNTATQVTFATVPTTYFQMDVRPSTAPNIQAAPAGYADVQRKVTVTSSGASLGDISLLKVGYRPSEYSNTPSRESYLRFVEGYSNANRGDKITTGIPIAAGDRDMVSANFHSVQINGGTPAPQHNIAMIAAAPGQNWEVGQTSDIVLTDEPNKFISIANGRWTNPNTWDEGTTPTENDNAELRTLVYAGINGPAFGTAITGNTTNEDAIYIGGVAAANNITIASGYPDAGLIIGKEDAKVADGYIFHTKYTGTAIGGLLPGLINQNAGTVTGDWENKNTDPATNNFFGLWIQAATVGTRIPIFGTASITNTGAITNNGTIEVSQ